MLIKELVIPNLISSSQFFGGYSEEATPVPIPNTEVKLFCADGTAGAAWWESRTPSKYFQKAWNHPIPGLFLLALGG